MSDRLADNSSPLSLLTVLKPGGSSCFLADSKPPKSIDDMIQLMKTRGLVVTDENNLKSMLYNCNYYRLSGYFRVFQVDPSSGNNQFKPGSKDVDFLVPYKMDEELRTIILKGTAQVELTLRSRFAYHVANSGGAYTYFNSDSYIKKSNISINNLLSNMNKWLEKSNEVCIKHYKSKKQPIPIWAAVEAFPFDTISRMISLYEDTNVLRKLFDSMGLKTEIRKSSEAIHSIVYLRNLCSHHCRLWYKETVISTPSIRDVKNSSLLNGYTDKSIAAALVNLMYLVSKIENNHNYETEIKDFLNKNEEYKNGIFNHLHWR